MARIGFIVQNNFPEPSDVRRDKVLKTLLDAGHEVVLLAPSADPRRYLRERDPLSGGNGDLPRLKAFQPTLWRSPLPFNPAWMLLIHRRAKAEGCRLLLVQNLRLALPALAAGRRLGLPVVWDCLEDYASMVSTAPRRHPGHWVLRDPRLVRRLEEHCGRRADLILVVIEESRDRWRGLGVAAERIAVVRNTPDLADWRPPPAAAAKNTGALQLLYVGVLAPVRGLDLLLRALSGLPDSLRHRFRLTILGDGESGELERLRGRAAALDLSDRVELPGRVAHDEVERRLAGADVGLIPHRLLPLTHTTIPNKLFEYMMFGLPVLATAMRPVERILSSCECGWTAADTVESLAQALARALDTDRAILREMGERGRRAVIREHNWSIDGDVLLRAVEGLLPGQARRPRAKEVR